MTLIEWGFLNFISCEDGSVALIESPMLILRIGEDKVLTEVAEKRLHAIKEFTELGSGFKIAMRDLSIRGAGNLLGAQQHGFIESVGFDLYSQMLKEAIDERKGRYSYKGRLLLLSRSSLNLDAYIPDAYIK